MSKLRIGFVLTGSFCTFAKVMPVIQALIERGDTVTPILSDSAGTLDTRSCRAKQQPAPVRSISWLSLLRLQSMRRQTRLCAKPLTPSLPAREHFSSRWSKLRSRCKMHAVW